MWYIIGGTAAAAVLVIFVILLLGRKGRRGYAKDNSRIIVLSGASVDSQRLVDGTGKYFDPMQEDVGTHLMEGGEMQVWNISLTDQKSGREYTFRFRDRMTVGRLPVQGESDVRLTIGDDSMVSKEHFEIYASGDALAARDLGSRNHTYLNGAMLTEPQILMSGDFLQAGNTVLQFHCSQLPAR